MAYDDEYMLTKTMWKDNPIGYYTHKCERQRAEIVRLQKRVDEHHSKDLIERCLTAEAQVLHIEYVRNRYNQSPYVKGYQAGYMAALKRHGIDAP